MKKIIHLFFTLLISQSVFAKNHDRIAVNSSANRLPKTIKVLPPKSTKTFVALPPITTNKPFITKRSVINSNVSVTNQLACTPLGASPGNVNITWTGLISDDWNTPCNWNPAWVPDVSNAKAIIPYNATNPPIISGTVPDVNSIDINLKGLLTINTGGTLNIRENGGTNNGIKIDGGQLNNVGTINIESTSNTAIDAYIYLTSGTSTDNSGLVNQGTIKINSTDEAIGVGIGGGGTGFAFIVNEATGIINIVDGIGVEVASPTDVMTFTNRGIINYNGDDLALSLQGTSSFINYGTFNINSGTGISKSVSVSIFNNNCGKIIMATGTYDNGGGITDNTGLIQMPNAYNFTNVGTFTNDGIVKANSVSGITNNEVVITNACPMFDIIGSAYAVDGIFTENTATTSAGTYTLASNEFVANNTVSSGLQTLYAKLSGGTSSCTFIVPFDFVNQKPTAVSISDSRICRGASVNLLATCASGTVNWYSSLTGGTAIGTGVSFNFTPPAGTTEKSYYASCESTYCKSSRTRTTNFVSVQASSINTIALSSAVGTNVQSVSTGSPITNITYATTEATGATFDGLPTGVTGVWSSNVATISGTPSTATGSPFNFTVTLTGGCGTITANGSITVVPTGCVLPNITIQPIGVSLCQGQGINLSVTASNVSYYQWQLNGVDITGANSATYTVATAASNNLGNYTVRLENGASSCAVRSRLAIVESRVTHFMQAVGCNCGGNSDVKVFINGGTSPYSFDYQSASGISTVTNYNSGTVITLNPKAIQVKVVSATDASGCKAIN